MSGRLARPLVMAATVLALTGLWWAYAVAFKVPRFVLPTPPEVLAAFWLLASIGFVFLIRRLPPLLPAEAGAAA